MAKNNQTKGARRKHKVTNWAEYSRALVRRGEVDVCMGADVGMPSADAAGGNRQLIERKIEEGEEEEAKRGAGWLLFYLVVHCAVTPSINWNVNLETKN